MKSNDAGAQAHLDALHILLKPLIECKGGKADIGSSKANDILYKWDVAREFKPQTNSPKYIASVIAERTKVLKKIETEKYVDLSTALKGDLQKAKFPALVTHKEFGPVILIKADASGAIFKTKKYQVTCFDVFSKEWLNCPMPT